MVDRSLVMQVHCNVIEMTGLFEKLLAVGIGLGQGLFVLDVVGSQSGGSAVTFLFLLSCAQS